MSSAADPGLDLRRLVERWVAGWVVARRFPPADRVGDALRVEVGLPGRRFEFVATDTAGTAFSLTDVAADAIRTPGRNWVTVITPRPDDLLAPLRDAGLTVEGDIEWLMWIDLRDQPIRAVPSPYRVDVDRDGDVLAASATTTDGEVAASGRMSLSGADAIADRILTVPGHKRRGLGGAVMGALATAALADGASTGILAASIEGERLYSGLRWHGVARLAVGRTEER